MNDESGLDSLNTDRENGHCEPRCGRLVFHHRGHLSLTETRA